MTEVQLLFPARHSIILMCILLVIFTLFLRQVDGNKAHFSRNSTYFPIPSCHNTTIDLLFVSSPDNRYFARQQSHLFRKILKVLLAPEEEELSRVRIGLISYTSNSSLREEFDFNRYSKKSHALDGLLNFARNPKKQRRCRWSRTKMTARSLAHLTSTTTGSDRQTSKVNIGTTRKQLDENGAEVEGDIKTVTLRIQNLEEFAFSRCFGARNDSLHVVLFVTVRSKTKEALKAHIYSREEQLRILFVIVNDRQHSALTSHSETDLKGVNHVLVKSPDVLQHSNEIPIMLCNRCFQAWSAFRDDNSRDTNDQARYTTCHKLATFKTKISWIEARDMCRTEHSNLVSIETVSELESVKALIEKSAWNISDANQFSYAGVDDFVLVHIGLLRDQTSMGKRFRWLNTAPLSFTHWSSHKEPNGGVIESCGTWVFKRFVKENTARGNRTNSAAVCEENANLIGINTSTTGHIPRINDNEESWENSTQSRSRSELNSTELTTNSAFSATCKTDILNHRNASEIGLIDNILHQESGPESDNIHSKCYTACSHSSGESVHYVEGWEDYGCAYNIAHFAVCESALNVFKDVNFNEMPPIPKASTKSIRMASFRGELAFCFDSETLVSVSAISISKDFKKCSLLEVSSNVVPINWRDHLIYFHCDDKFNTKLSYIFVCDHISQCPNGRDELLCGHRPCSRHEFTCSSGQCIPLDGECDLYQDCFDASDETHCEVCKHFRCPNGQCLPKHWWYDEETDCVGYLGQHAISLSGGWDTDLFSDKKVGTCAFICNRTECVEISMLNDGVVDCLGPEGALDETIGSLETFDCHSRLAHYNSSSWSPRCVYFKDKYGESLGCRNMEHLKECKDFVCPEGYLKCPRSHCIPLHLAHDGIVDCPYGEDERKDFYVNCSGNFACMGSDICVHPDMVCDGHKHCPSGDDEINCNVICKDGFFCLGGAVTVQDIEKAKDINFVKFIDHRTRYLDLSGVVLTKIFPRYIFNKEEKFNSLVVVRLSRCQIRTVYIARHESDTSAFTQLWTVQTLDLSYNTIKTIPQANIFQYMASLRVLNMSHNARLKTFSSKAFGPYKFRSLINVLDLSYTKIFFLPIGGFLPLTSLTHLNLSKTKIRNLPPGSLPISSRFRVLDLRFVPIQKFYRDTFKGVTVRSRLYTDMYQLCCPEVSDPGVGPGVCQAPDDPLSSCLDLMSHMHLKVLLWIMGFLAVLGNITVITYRLKWRGLSLNKTYTVFVINLSISDLIMGIYMLLIASVDVYYRNNYIWHERSWRHSVLCETASFLSTLSSEVSVMFILLITGERYLAIKYPYGNVRFSKLGCYLSCILAWFIGVAIAIVPLLPPFKYWEIHNSNGMCLGLPLVGQRLPGWEYAMGIFVCLNSVMFLLIVLGQISVYRCMTASTKSRGDLGKLHSWRVQEFEVTKQLVLVAATDFLCWFPIGVMGLATLNGREVGLDAYAWTAVLVLPVNSALNPLLYTLPALWKKWQEVKLGKSYSTGKMVLNDKPAGRRAAT